MIHHNSACLTLKSFVGDDSTNAVLGVDSDVAEVGQGGGQLDEQVAGEDSHPTHYIILIQMKQGRLKNL